MHAACCLVMPGNIQSPLSRHQRHARHAGSEKQVDRGPAPPLHPQPKPFACPDSSPAKDGEAGGNNRGTVCYRHSPDPRPTRIAIYLRTKSPLYSTTYDEVVRRTSSILEVLCDQSRLLAIQKWTKLTALVFEDQTGATPPKYESPRDTSML
ncbi:hypothetical protein QBC33DRAFT_2568 [Phialemonium atrogriseum]|uniref:Uncharacterized protein n=1 Tax=Phialemonium atrogriseum TaxID=1093897 RepID=A0AAJ0C9W1_9PEZI|nr:uncharacterized protein QBC33DRAFT_2568 [Phialemonium atrogriseum]KAK1772232.1 hypothetical protein QBC33DRAFT_2568 [Phialemonium atrogriseum]